MAFVLSNQANIDLLLLLVNLAIALGAIAIVLWLLLWLRLKNLEKFTYLKRSPLRSRLINLNSPPPHKTLVARPTTISRPNSAFSSTLNRNANVTTIRKPTIANQLYRPTTPTSLKKAPKMTRPSVSSRWQWLWAIAIACMTGTAIALLQLGLGNSLISPEYVTLIWMLIGLGLVISAAYIL